MNRPTWQISMVVLALVAYRVELHAAADEPDAAQAEALILERTNAFRSEHDVGGLQRDEALDDAARHFAEFMARTGAYGHTADGRTPAERARMHGYAYCVIAENIAWQLRSDGFTTRELARTFFEGWRDSRRHRENMLDPDVTQAGIAIAQSSDSGRFYAVQMLGRPRAAAIRLRLSNQASQTISYRLGDRERTVEPRHVVSHQICRKRKLRVLWPEQDRSASGAAEEVITPSDGARYVISLDADGKYALERQ